MNSSLIDKLIKEPLLFDSSQINELINPSASPVPTSFSMGAIPAENTRPSKNTPVTHKEIVSIIRRIFDLNEDAPLGAADKGLLGFLNRRSRRRRLRRFHKMLRRHPGAKKIYAEGDSWFEHPLMKDIIDFMRILSRKERKAYAVFSSAYGGDWLTNIIREGKYISDVSIVKPDVIMLSGGGNDLIEDKRLAMLVSKEFGSLRGDFHHLIDQPGEEISAQINRHPYLKKVICTDELNTDEKLKQFAEGISYLSKDFFSLLWAFELQYKFVINNLLRKHSDIQIITQGYDYAIPSSKKGSFFNLKQFALNIFQSNGKWLKDALLYRGISEKSTQRNILFALIFLFNEMLIRVGKDAVSKGNVYHVDVRGTTGEKDWFDEMHVKPRIFKKIAATMLECINHKERPQRVYRVRK